jgi:hypothetical protein
MKNQKLLGIIFIPIMLCVIGCAVAYFIFAGGGNVITGGGIILSNDGIIDEKAFSLYAKICEVDKEPYEKKDSPNFVKEAAQFKYFYSKSVFIPPKVLVIESDGDPYITQKGIGGDWNPRRLYDVQVVACVGEERSGRTNTHKCNGQTYKVYSRTLDVYQAKTGKWIMSGGLAEPDECGGVGYQSLQYISTSIADASICYSCVVVQ